MMDGASVYFLSLRVFVVFAEVSVSRSPGPSPSAAIKEPAGRSPSEVTSKCVVVQASQSPLGPDPSSRDPLEVLGEPNEHRSHQLKKKITQ